MNKIDLSPYAHLRESQFEKLDEAGSPDDEVSSRYPVKPHISNVGFGNNKEKSQALKIISSDIKKIETFIPVWKDLIKIKNKFMKNSIYLTHTLDKETQNMLNDLDKLMQDIETLEMKWNKTPQILQTLKARLKRIK